MRVVVEVPDSWWLIIHFLFFPIIKMYSLLSIILSFSSVFLLITADDALNILMPDVIANHVGVFFNEGLCNII
jgi:hypothetical protein